MGQDVPRRKIPGYTLLERLGEGGMGAVFLARHEATGATRALKLVVGLGGPELVRFRREAAAMAAASGHPNVLTVHEAGEEKGLAYYVMDVATGGDLERRLRSGPLEPAAVVELGVALARGLAHLHGKGLLHRDVKPSNVLFDERGTPRLVDFGLARRLDGAETRLTQTGSLVGTPAYMSPEQVTGRRELDERTDLWALGMVLHQAATGRYPFGEGIQLSEMLVRITRAPLAPLPMLPPAVEAVVLRCLERDRAARFGSAAEVVRALEAARAGSAAPARGVGPVLALAALAALTVLAAALAFALRSPAATGPAAAGPPPPAPRAPAGAKAHAVDARALEAALASALAEEDAGAALAQLEEALAVDPGAVPAAWLRAALVVADDPAALEAWRVGGAAHVPLAAAAGEAADLLEALRGGDGAPRVAGTAPVVRSLAELRAVLAAWRAGDFARPPVEALPALERVVEVAEAAPAREVGLALRTRVQRELLAVDGALLRLTPRRDVVPRLLEVLGRARALAPGTRAAAALRVVERWIAWRTGGDRTGPVVLLGPRYPRQELTQAALAALLDGRPDEARADACRAAWAEVLARARALGLADARGALTRETDYEGAPLLELLYDALEHLAHALAFRAHARRDAPGAAAAREEALAAGQARRALAVRWLDTVPMLHLARGDVAAARDALSALDERDRLPMDLELALLEGDQDAVRALAPRLGPRVGERCLAALLRALEGDAAGCERELAAARQVPGFAHAPWRTPEETALAVAAARRGWRPWTARAPFPRAE